MLSLFNNDLVGVTDRQRMFVFYEIVFRFTAVVMARKCCHLTVIKANILLDYTT